MELKDKSGRTLEIYDGIGGLTFHIYKEREDGHKFFVTDDMAQKIIAFFNQSQNLTVRYEARSSLDKFI